MVFPFARRVSEDALVRFLIQSRSSQESFLAPDIVNSAIQPHIHTTKLDHAAIVGEWPCPRAMFGDMATKAAYFSVAVAAFIFVAMTLLPGLHP
jgi:hypothetical protein